MQAAQFYRAIPSARSANPFHPNQGPGSWLQDEDFDCANNQYNQTSHTSRGGSDGRSPAFRRQFRLKPGP